TGTWNIFIGHAAGFQYTSGDLNTWIGDGAGNQGSSALARTGGRNIGIGQLTGPFDTCPSCTMTLTIGPSPDGVLAPNVQASNMTKIGVSMTDASISGRLYSTVQNTS